MDWFSGVLAQLSKMFHNSRLLRSGFTPVLVVAVILAAAGGIWHEHMQGAFHRIRIIPAIREKTSGARPGNMDLAQLVRTPMVSTINPEFISATAAPGDGMDVLQATITLPGMGDIPLLVATGLGDKGELTDTSEGSRVVVDVAPVSSHQTDPAINILKHRPADRVSSNPTPDGMGTESLYASAHVGEATASGIETTVSTTLGGRSLNVTVTARNVSKQARAVTLSWQPRFSTRQGGFVLIPPHTGDNRSGAAPLAIDLGSKSVTTAYSNLSRGFRVDGTELQLRNDKGGYILHLVASTPTIRTLSVDAPRGGDAVTVGLSTAGEGADKGKTILEPGETLHMEARLQVSAITSRPR